MKPSIRLWSYLAKFFLKWEVFLTKFVEKIKTRTLCSITPPQNHAIYELTWKITVQLDRPQTYVVQSSWNVMAHSDTQEEKWRGNWRMEHGVSSITISDAHTSAASSRLNWRLRQFKWTRPLRRTMKSGFLHVCHHISNAVYLVLCYCSNGCTNVPQCYMYIACLVCLHTGNIKNT
jgi:hypothetical protein